MSLCRSCAHVRLTEGRRGQTYLLCRNEAVSAKYPPQPVARCAGYAAAPPAGPPPAAPAPGIVPPDPR